MRQCRSEQTATLKQYSHNKKYVHTHVILKHEYYSNITLETRSIGAYGENVSYREWLCNPLVCCIVSTHIHTLLLFVAELLLLLAPRMIDESGAA